MIYQKSISHLCDSYLSVTLYLQLSMKEQPKSTGWKRYWVFQRRTVLRKSGSMDGWSSCSSSPSGPQFIFLLCHTLVICHCWGITKYHFPARQCSMQDSTSPAGLLEYSEEIFSKNNVLGISFVLCLELGPKTTPLLVMRKGLSLLVETNQNLFPFHKEKWIPRLCQQTERSKWWGWFLNMSTQMNMFSITQEQEGVQYNV